MSLGLASIILVGLSASYPIPGVYIELDFAQGQSSGSGGARKVLLMGNKRTTGSATADTVIYGPDTAIPCQTEADVVTLFGAGSQLHRMFKRFVKINKTSPLYLLAVTESGGTAATTTQTIATTATSNGNCRVWCGDQFVDTPISTGDNATTIATNIVASVNAQTDWPVTAGNSSGVITYTAKNKGPEGNWIPMQAAITGSGVGSTTTLTANTLLTSGATADSMTTAIGTVAPMRFYYIACADSDPTNVGALVSQVNSDALPTTGIRRRVVAGGADTLANEITIATGLNAPRAELVWTGHGSVDVTPAEAAAHMCAIYSLLEEGSDVGVARKNFSNFPVTDTDAASWALIPGRGGSAVAPTQAQIQSALNNGITPVAINPRTGQPYLVKRVTTKSLSGSTADYRVRDAHKVTVCDYFCDDAAAVTAKNFGGKDLLPDPVLGQPLGAYATATYPRQWKGALKQLVDAYGGAGQWSYIPGVTPSPTQTPADVIKAAMIVQAENSDPNRLSALIPLSPVNLADKFAMLAQQVG